MTSLDRAVAALWDRAERPNLGRPPVLSSERIVAVAIELADAEGLRAVSMQRVAETLGFTKMSLYRYTPGKAELLALMLDTALGPPPDLAGIAGGWRPKLREWTARMRAAMLRHPWGLEVASGVRVLGPNETAWLEVGLVALADLGLDGAERLDAIVTLGNLLRGALSQQHADHGVERQMASAMQRVLDEHSSRFPAVHAAFGDAIATGKLDQALEFGLQRVLDGLAILIAERSAPSQR